jgi:hypothetical protein
MLAYWLLFGLFAVGAFRFATIAPSAPAAGAPPQPASPHFTRLRKTDRTLFLASLIPCLLIGLRFEVGADWFVYVDMFEEIRERSFWFALSRIDPGYGLVNWVSAKAGFEIWLVNFICGVLFMFGVVRFAKAQTHPWLAITVAVPYLIVVVGMGYSRQAVAIGLGMAGLAAVSKGSFLRFVLWVLAAGLFHRSAVILIPLVAVAYSRNRFQTVIVGIIACVLGYYVLQQGQGLQHFERGYITEARESQGAGIRLAMNLPPAILFLALAQRFTRDPIERRVWRIFSAIAVVSFIAWFFVATSTALDRMALYVIPLQLFVLSRLPAVFASPGRSSGLLVFAAVLYSALVLFVWLNFADNAPAWMPYRLYPLS